jgi:nucleoside phosphorylase
MNYSVKVTWKLFYKLTDSRRPAAGEASSNFSVKTGKSLLRAIGGTVQSDFSPLVLEPTSPFFSKIAKAARNSGIALKKTQFEADGSVFGFSSNISLSGSFALHLYERQLCISIDGEFQLAALDDLAAAISLPESASIRLFAGRLAELVVADFGANGGISDSAKVYPCVKLISKNTDLPVSINRLVELLTRHASPSLNVVEEVYAKNISHQVDGTLALLDRQGIVCYAPPGAHSDEIANCDRRFLSCSALLEVAAAIQRLTLDAMPSELLRTADSLLVNPKRAIPNSTSASRAWSLLINEFGLCLHPKQAESDAFLTESIPELPRPKRNVLCIAAATVELSSVHKYLKDKFGDPALEPILDGDDYALKFEDKSQKSIWYVAPLSFQGQIEAAVSTKHLCVVLKPDLLIMVGMCMSMPQKAMPAGTVVIPNEVMVFDHQRLITEGTQVRPHGDRVDNGLFKFARLVAITKSFAYKVVTDKGLASATAKVENPKADLVAFIEKTFPDAAAFDMEGWGFYRASSGQQCLWIKAVADAGEPQARDVNAQDHKKSTQADVTANAIDFAFKLVDEFVSLPS